MTYFSGVNRSFREGLLMVLGAVLELITGLLSSGCLWIVAGVVIVVAIL